MEDKTQLEETKRKPPPQPSKPPSGSTYCAYSDNNTPSKNKQYTQLQDSVSKPPLDPCYKSTYISLYSPTTISLSIQTTQLGQKKKPLLLSHSQTLPQQGPRPRTPANALETSRTQNPAFSKHEMGSPSDKKKKTFHSLLKKKKQACSQKTQIWASRRLGPSRGGGFSQIKSFFASQDSCPPPFLGGGGAPKKYLLRQGFKEPP